MASRSRKGRKWITPPGAPRRSQPRPHLHGSPARLVLICGAVNMGCIKPLSLWSLVTVDTRLLQTPEAVVVSWDDRPQWADTRQHLETPVAVGTEETGSAGI